MVNAKLFVPAGGLDQDNGGETFSPTQFGLDLLSPAFFFASGVPSLKAEDVNMKGSAAFPTRPAHHDARIVAAARNRFPRRSLQLLFTFVFLLFPWLLSLTFSPSGLLSAPTVI